MSGQSEAGRRFFTTSEVARYCAVTNDGVLKWIKSGKLRAFSTPGGHYRVSSDDFREFLQKYDIPIDEAFFTGVSKARSVLVVGVDSEAPVVHESLSEAEADGRTGGIRTPDLLVRSQSLYPTELRSGLLRRRKAGK